MYEINFCYLCSARDDLLRITKEKERLINSVLQKQIPKDKISRICINCSSLLSYLGKFQETSRTTQNIMEEQKTSLQDQNYFIDLPSANQDKVSDAFDTILNWLTGVNVVLEHHSITTDHEVSSNTVPIQGSADTLIISSVHGKEFVTEEYLPKNSKDKENECEVFTTEIIKKEYDYGVESSSDESEEPTIDFLDENNEIQNEPQTEKPSQEHDDENLMKNIENTNKGVTNRPYICNECKKCFTRKELKYHFNSHTNKRPFKCIIEGCSKAYHSSPYVAQRCREFHKLKVSASKLTTNEASSDESDEPMIEMFDDFDDDDLDQYRTKINGKIYFKCPTCQQTFNQRDKLKYHKNFHKGLRPFKCIVEGCSKAYISPYRAVDHCRESHQLKVRASKWTNKKQEEARTEKIIQELDDDFEKYIDNSKKGKEQRYYKCPACNKLFKRLALEYHFNFHKGLTPFKCFVKGCSKAYSSAYTAQQHCKKIHKLNVNPLKWTTNQASSDESDEPNDDNLEKYRLEKTFKGRSQYKCPKCKKIYGQYSRLKYHLNLHKGITPFKCSVEGCSKAYVCADRLQTHCKRYHKLNVNTNT